MSELKPSRLGDIFLNAAAQMGRLNVRNGCTLELRSLSAILSHASLVTTPIFLQSLEVKRMKPITIMLTEGYSDWEVATLAGAGRAFYGADTRFVSPGGGSLTSSGGLNVAHTERFEAPDGGVVVICGSSIFETNAPDLSAQLRKARDAGCIIAGICGGTIALARAGMLDDTQHTSNGPGYLEQHAKGYKGGHLYVDQPRAIRSGDIITAPAPAPASFAAEVLAAAGLDRAKAEELSNMLAKEHLG